MWQQSDRLWRRGAFVARIRLSGVKGWVRPVSRDGGPRPPAGSAAAEAFMAMRRLRAVAAPHGGARAAAQSKTEALSGPSARPRCKRRADRFGECRRAGVMAASTERLAGARPARLASLSVSTTHPHIGGMHGRPLRPGSIGYGLHGRPCAVIFWPISAPLTATIAHPACSHRTNGEAAGYSNPGRAAAGPLRAGSLHPPRSWLALPTAQPCPRGVSSGTASSPRMPRRSRAPLPHGKECRGV
jgi:hypothetical protein